MLIRKILFPIALSIISIASLVACTAFAPTPEPRQSDPVKVTTNETALEHRWSIPIDTAGFACQGEYVAVVGHREGDEGWGAYLFGSNGDLIWQELETPTLAVGSSLVAIDDQRAYYVYSGGNLLNGGGDHLLVAADLETGDVLWQTSKSLFYRQGAPNLLWSPMDDQPTLWYMAQTMIVAFDPQSGDRVGYERLEDQTLIYRSQLVDIHLGDGGQYARDRTSGEIVWMVPYPIPTYGRYPTERGDSLYFTYAGGVCRVRQTNGEELWCQPFASNVIFLGENAFALHQDGDLVSFDPNTGEVLSRMSFEVPYEFGTLESCQDDAGLVAHFWPTDELIYFAFQKQE